MFAREKFREGQKDLYCPFLDLEKVYDGELWYCTRTSGCEGGAGRDEVSKTVVRCAVETGSSWEWD